MPRMSQQDYESFLRKQSGTTVAGGHDPQGGEPVPLEIPLHNKIITYCLSQFPRWKYLHADPSRRSTIALGCHDFTLFLPGQKLLCVECKARGGKLDPDQVIWKHEMETLGHKIYVVYNFDQFLNAVDEVMHGVKESK